jgi:hypothetical protein
MANPIAVRTLDAKRYINPPDSTQETLSISFLSSMDLSFINDIRLEDLELDENTRAALTLVDLSDYRPTPDATAAINPSLLPNHPASSLASAESLSPNSNSPILCTPQPARIIHHHIWNVPDVTPQSPGTEQLSQALSLAGLAFTNPLIADEWRAHSAPTNVPSCMQNSSVSQTATSAPSSVADHRFDMRVNTPCLGLQGPMLKVSC